MAARRKSLYRIFFTSQEKAYEIYARKVEQAELYGFVLIEDIVFGEKSTIVVDPGEECLKSEFGGVKRLMIPYHSVARIDEVEREGQGKIHALKPTHSETAPSPLMPPLPK